MNYQTELITRLMRRVQSYGNAAMDTFKSDVSQTPSGVQGESLGAEQSLRQSQKDLDMVSNIIEDLSSKDTKKFSSLSEYAAATNQSIARKKQALVEINKAKSVDSADNTIAQYFNPFTGQMEQGTEADIASDEIRSRVDADKNMIALYDIQKTLNQGDLTKAVGHEVTTEMVHKKDVYINERDRTRATDANKNIEFTQARPNQSGLWSVFEKVTDDPFAGLTSKDRNRNLKSLGRQVNDQIKRVKTGLEEGYQNELSMRQKNASEFADKSNALANEAVLKQREAAEKFAAEQEREIRESIETDKRSLAKAAGSRNAEARRKVKIRPDDDTNQRPV